MLTPHISDQARSDLRNIWKYSFENWGEIVSNNYIHQISRKINKDLVRNPKLGIMCNDVKYKYRKIAVGSHLVFYKVDAKKIFVVRILHKRMDYKTIL